MAQFASDTEERVFREEWEKTRREVLAKLKGKIIIITDNGKEYKKEYGFIDRSRSAASD